MNAQDKDLLRCRLFFYAVFPCLEELLRLSKEARELLGDVEFSLCFKTISGLRTCLGFEEGRCHFYGPRQTPADLELLFTSAKQAVRTFDNRWALPPVPTRGLGHLTKMSRFKKLGDLLQQYLEPDLKRLDDAEYRAIVTELSLCAAFAGACQLAQFEPESQKLVAGWKGTVLFQVGSLMRPVWLRLGDGEATWGRGTPQAEIHASVDLLTTETAIGALLDRIDQQAEVGLGRIRIQGVAPLADVVGLLLERVSTYFDSSGKGTAKNG